MADEELPPAVARRLELIHQRLGEIVRGTSSWREVASELQVELEGAVIGAAQVAEDPLDSEMEKDPIDIGGVVAGNVRALRGEADWTQAAVAEAMTRIGFDWKRITVAEVEAGNRRVQLEELLAIAGLFGVPLAELLLPDHRQPLAWRDRAPLPAHVVTELVCGAAGKIGSGGPGWLPAVLVCGTESGRPAGDYWRSGSVRYGLRRRMSGSGDR